MKKDKGIALILVILLTLLVISIPVGIKLYSSVSKIGLADPADAWPKYTKEDWKTYTNDQYGYKFQYSPAGDLELQTCGSDPNDFLGEDMAIFKPKNEDISTCFNIEWYEILSIEAAENMPADKEEVAEKYPDCNTMEYKDQSRRTSAILNCLSEVNEGEMEYKLFISWIKGNENDYRITLSDETHKDLYDQILSTFEFTNKTNLKTYTNTNYGFTFNYPERLTIEESTENTEELRVSIPNVFQTEISNNTVSEQLNLLKSFYGGHVISELESEEDIGFLGYPAKKLVYNDPNQQAGGVSLIIVNNGSYTYTLYSFDETGDEILSTFEFIEEEKL